MAMSKKLPLLFSSIIAAMFSYAQPLEFNIDIQGCVPLGQAISLTQYVSGGNPPYTFSGPGINGTTYVGFSGGSQILCVSDINGTVCDTIIHCLIDVSNQTCCPTLYGAGGFSSYLWSNGAVTQTIEVCQVGTYYLTVSDNLGNITTDSINITSVGIPIDSIQYADTSVTQCGGNDGSITITNVYGGNMPYYYVWSHGATTSSVYGLPAGVYTVTVVGVDGCEYTESITLSDPNSPVLTLDSVSTLGCGNDEAYIGISVSGGTPGYTYEWSWNGSVISSSAPPLINAVAGIYSLQVTDGLFCSSWLTVEITDSCGAATGRVFSDLNGNGIDDGEPGISGVVIQTTSGFSTGVSNPFGYYYVNLPDTGTFEITPLVFPQFYTPCSIFYLSDSEITMPLDSTLTVQISSGNFVSSGNDFGFTEPNNPCGTISGHVFNDVNQDGIENNGETGYNAVNIRITNSLGQISITQTNGTGDYSIEVPLNDTYTVSVVTNNTSYYCNYSQSTLQTFPTGNQGYTVTLNNSNPVSAGNNFGLRYAEGFDATVVGFNAYNGVHAGRTFNAQMDYKLYGNFTGGCTLTLEFDPLITFVSATIPPSVTGPGYIQWTYMGNTTPTPFWHCVGMTFYLDSSAVAGQNIEWTATFSCTENDACPDNNEIIRNYTIQSGPLKTESTYWGPIAKEVLHTGNQSNGNISHSDSTFSYIINFQNTTPDTVKHVFIIDKLSPYLDVTTLSMPFAMQPYKLYVPDDETMVLEIDNINLPPAETDFAASYGFIQYNIRMKPNLPFGTVIENKAWIRYNYGDSIETNKVSNLLVNPDSYPENTINSEINIYPNPANTSVIIESKIAKGIYQLQDLTGKVLLRGSVTATKFSLDISALSKGIYLLSLIDGEQQVNKKVVKE
jgi:hypothetical protein